MLSGLAPALPSAASGSMKTLRLAASPAPTVRVPLVLAAGASQPGQPPAPIQAARQGSARMAPRVLISALVTGGLTVRTRRHRRHHRREVRGAKLTARRSAPAIVASVWAAAQLAKAAAVGASVVGGMAGLQEAKDEEENAPPPEHLSGKKPKVVVLGSGWGAATFLKGLSEKEAQMYEITVVSPRNFFLYTPLLPACTMGSIEDRSIVTPVRQLIMGKADYLEAKCDSIDAVKKIVRCSRPGRPVNRSAGLTPSKSAPIPDGAIESDITFPLDYDILIYAVGAQVNTFDIPGVVQHANFFKESEHARRIRDRISDVFERACLPTTTYFEKRALLSFVVVGGGPTGVEVAADLADFVATDAVDLYPKVVDLVKIRLVDVGEHLLFDFDREVSDKSREVFEQRGVQVLSGHCVTEVKPNEVCVRRLSDGEIVEIPYGCCIWAAGITENSLTLGLKKSLIELNEGVSELNISSLKRPASGIITDEWLHVRGSAGSIFALGDAATVRHDRVLPFAEQLFKAADLDNSGGLDSSELRDLFIGASEAFPQMEEYADMMSASLSDDNEKSNPTDRLVQFVKQGLDTERRAFKEAVGSVSQTVGDLVARKGLDAARLDVIESDENKDDVIDLEEFKKLLERIDKNLQPFPPTAQVASQQGQYLAKLFAKGYVDGTSETWAQALSKSARFTYFHKGALAYLGDGSAALDLPIVGPVTGVAAGLITKLYEPTARLSWRNRALMGLEFIRGQLLGGGLCAWPRRARSAPQSLTWMGSPR